MTLVAAADDPQTVCSLSASSTAPAPGIVADLVASWTGVAGSTKGWTGLVPPQA